MNFCKSNFSLIEIMISITIIVLVSSVIGIKINKSIERYNFNKASYQIFKKIKFARQMALTNQCDVSLELYKDSQKEKKMFCNIKVDNKKKDTQSFKSVYFKFSSNEGSAKHKNLKIIFYSNGNFYPNGTLFLYKNKEDLSNNEDVAQNQKIEMNKEFLKENLFEN